MRAIIGALAAGLLIGPWLSGGGEQISEVSKWVIQLIKAVAVPLLFLAVLNAIAHAEVTVSHGLRLLRVALTNALIALLVGIGLSSWLKPGLMLRQIWSDSASADGAEALPALPPLNVWKTLSSWIPQGVAHPFVDNAVIPAVILAILFGVALRSEEQGENAGLVTAWKKHLELAQRVCERVLFAVTRLIPLAVFAAVASSVAKYGFSPMLALLPYLGVALLGLALHILITYQAWIRLVARIPLKRFWGEARVPVVQSIATNSSLATLPFTLRALDRLGVSKRASALGACVGTNLNNDGIILYEGMAFLFVAQALGADLSLTQQVAGAALCLVTAMGIAGVPDAGFISLALVLATLGLPTEKLALLLSVDWILGRARSVTNVLSDMVVSIAVDERKS